MNEPYLLCALVGRVWYFLTALLVKLATLSLVCPASFPNVPASTGVIS
ncbi:MAG: hypothetical protein ACR2FX_05450 [Chthoniobacterales bacterium]